MSVVATARVRSFARRVWGRGAANMACSHHCSFELAERSFPLTPLYCQTLDLRRTPHDCPAVLHTRSSAWRQVTVPRSLTRERSALRRPISRARQVAPELAPREPTC